jgi:Ca-activated chloride channel family protein
MTTLSKFSPDDPRLTAFALGELEGEELAAVEAALRDDPAARAAVEEIRATASQLGAVLGAEAAADPVSAGAPPLRRAAIVPGQDLHKLDGGPLAKVIKFPQVYYIVGGLAAAAFAVLVVQYQSPVSRQRAEKKSYFEVSLPAPTDDGRKNEPERGRAVDAMAKISAQAVQDKKQRDELVSSNEPSGALAGATGAAKSSVASANAFKELPPASSPVAAAPYEYGAVRADSAGGRVEADDASGKLDANGPVALAQFSVGADKDQGYAKAKAPTGGSPMDLEVQRQQSQPRNIGALGFQGGGNLKNAQYRAYIQSNSDGAQFNALNSGQLADAARAKSLSNTEGYAYQHDNDFLGAGENPLSTFSIDVDTASYANVRRFLTGGQLPPPDAVRIEELVNYFPYRYAPPPAAERSDASAAPFAASMEVAQAPWAPEHRLVRIGLKGREVSLAARGAANLVFLLDVSGSMDEPNKLPLVKESMRLLVGKLRPDDRVAIVVYAGASGLALPSTPVAKSAEILAALDALTPGGSTNGAMGLQLAYDIAKANFVAGGLNRVILCTDGDFNVGVTSEGDLTRLIEEKAKSGVFLTVLGFGMGNYKDATLEKLADKGNGNYGYIDTRREAEKLLVDQVSGTLVTIAKDVKLQVEFNPAQVASYRLIGYENRLLKKEDFNNDAVDAGEIGAGHTVTALYEIVPVGAEGKATASTPAVDELKYRSAETRKAEGGNRKSEIGNPKSAELLTLKVRYKEPTGAVSRKLEFPLTDSSARFADASADFKFAAAVAEFGMILRDSPHKGTGTLADVLAWAQAGTDSDAGGYREEFIRLVRQAQALMR